MIEIPRGADGRFAMGFCGGAFWTSIYLARAGSEVALASAIGRDPSSHPIMHAAAADGVATDLVLQIADRVPGLWLVETDKKGPRIECWREAAPARQLFELPRWDHIAEELVAAELIYLTGITLSLYSNVGLGRLL